MAMILQRYSDPQSSVAEAYKSRHIRIGPSAHHILPAMALPEVLDTTRTHSVAGWTGDHTAVATTRPFRAPQHAIADVGVIGGGQMPMPGAVSLAHHGLRSLDERPEFKRHLLEVWRQPLEEDRAWPLMTSWPKSSTSSNASDESPIVP
jgi:hypothetical protein